MLAAHKFHVQPLSKIWTSRNDGKCFVGFILSKCFVKRCLFTSLKKKINSFFICHMKKRKKIPRAFASLFKFFKKKTICHFECLWSLSQMPCLIWHLPRKCPTNGLAALARGSWGAGWGGWRQMRRVACIHAAPPRGDEGRVSVETVTPPERDCPEWF